MMNTWYGQSFGLGPVPFLGLGLLVAVIAIVVIVLKGYSLWYAARRSEKWRFIILLIVNTAGILELIYLIFVVKKWHKIAGSGTPTSTPTTPTPVV